MKEQTISETTKAFFEELRYKLFTEHILCEFSYNNKKVNDDEEDDFTGGHVKIIKEYQLRMVEESSLQSLRNSGIPGFILKCTGRNGKTEYWYSEIDPNYSTNSKHWFGQKCRCCDILGSADGACLSTCAWAYSLKHAIKFESLPYVVTAVETFNNKIGGSISVIQCRHFKESTHITKEVTRAERKRNALKLSQFLDEGIETFGDLEQFERDRKF